MNPQPLLKTQPEVTVIVPCFNGESHLDACLKSILNQKDAVFEVIVVDDGSDNPAEIIKICAEQQDSRVRLIRQDNRGVSSALNVGLLNSKAPLFCWLSHDDQFTPNRLRDQLKIWHGTPLDRKLIYGDFEVISKNSSLGGRTRIGSFAEQIDLLALGLINGCTVMAAKADVLQLGGFDERLRTTQDFDLWLRLMRAGSIFVYMPKVLCLSFEHESQGSKSAPERQIENQVLWKEIAIELSKEYEKYGRRKHDKRLRDLYNFLCSSSFHKNLNMSENLSAINSLYLLGNSRDNTKKVRAAGPVEKYLAKILWRAVTLLPFFRSLQTLLLHNPIFRPAIYWLQKMKETNK